MTERLDRLHDWITSRHNYFTARLFHDSAAPQHFTEYGIGKNIKPPQIDHLR